jgi:hypothetical protein
MFSHCEWGKKFFTLPDLMGSGEKSAMLSGVFEIWHK